METVLIDLRGVTRSFGGTPVLRGVDLQAYEGETLVLLGRSGSGKTVLLKLIIGLLHPDGGHVIVDGVDLEQLSPAQMRAHWRKLGILFQSGALFDSLTVFENVAFPLVELGHVRGRELRERVDQALAIVGLRDAAKELPGELSGGMQKRVAFARAFVQRPRLLLYDDPTAGLDPVLAEVVAELISTGQRELGSSAILVSSDLRIAFKLASRMAFLHEGRILFEGSPEAFRTNQSPAIAAYVHSFNERMEVEARP